MTYQQDHPIGSASVKVPLTENVHQTNNEPYAIAKHEESDHGGFTRTWRYVVGIN